ncbi:cleft lip and palate transmembrane protein 1 homolog [Prunus yedoensis var. nudiflora]|uniref:Cleft lip and palate transmembrane protein 1 homolog n=1 Tax=Prunus yedoensis var. nudiflora TaxID=2094558 RepID=A0A314UJG2_PRUYE|nr:cleft lip and palate transmembrane protein 1 homolog [Prunus yedoensis var. nudiflora]
MAPPAAAAAEGQVQRGQQQGGGGFGQSITGIIRIAVFWYFASKFFSPKKPSDPTQLSTNLFQKAEPLDMWLYLSEREKEYEISSMKYYPSEALKHNGSLYAHVFFARSGYPPDPSDPEYQPLAVFGKTHSIVTHLPKSKAGKKRSLLGGSKDSDEKEPLIEVVDDTQGDSEDNGPVEWVSYWKPNITINLVDDFTGYAHNAVPPNVAPYLNLEPSTGNYFPTIFFNEFWLLRDKMIAINETVKELALNLVVGPISMTKWQLFLQIDQSFQIHRSYGSMLEGEADELKRVFLEGNPYLLGITMVVSLLHSVFDFLAFKNDIQFWNKNKSMEGLSAKSVIVSFICQLIVFLYLLDNETSWMILASSGIGCCIEFWKIGKAMHIEIDRTGRIPMLRFRDRESYAGNKTKEYDDMAMKYLSYVLFFLVACSSVYSLKYERHKSWYSWILSSLTSCVYMFGFIMMCPQLFINYKLKSVAHLPWRQMTYKFLNTIIDDLFAFVIKMPILHRLSVFRDDVIFLIYVYQRWKYPVDKKRVNEFGFSGDDEVTEGAVDTAVKEEEKKTN